METCINDKKKEEIHPLGRVSFTRNIFLHSTHREDKS
jgi:hypothetical protein